MKEIYEKDYANPDVDRESPLEIIKISEESGELNIAEFYKIYMEPVIKHIVPKEQANYDYLLKRCDELAKKHDGKIYGLVDDESCEAKIRLTLPTFIEFIDDDELLLLKEIAEESNAVTFSVTEEGSLLLSIRINYFLEDESYDDFLKERAKDFIKRNGLTYEEIASKMDVRTEALKTLFGD